MQLSFATGFPHHKKKFQKYYFPHKFVHTILNRKHNGMEFSIFVYCFLTHFSQKEHNYYIYELGLF